MDITSVSNDIASLAIVVASYVGVIKTLGLNPKYSPLVALLIAAIFILVPDNVQAKMLLISIVGLTASGAYSQIKKDDKR
jgi:hypothetical protein